MGAVLTWVQPVLAFQHFVILVIDFFFFFNLLIDGWRKAGGWACGGEPSHCHTMAHNLFHVPVLICWGVAFLDQCVKVTGITGKERRDQ